MPNVCVVYFPAYDAARGLREVEAVLIRGEFSLIDQAVQACLAVKRRHPHLTAAYAAGELLIGPGTTYASNKSPYEYPRGTLVSWMGEVVSGSFEGVVRRELAKYFPPLGAGVAKTEGS
jgi:hypothetical protein